MVDDQSYNEEQARILALSLAKLKRKAELNVIDFEDKETQADLKLASDSKEVQCWIQQQTKVSKFVQTKPWRDPLTEQRDIVKRFYVDTYGQISKGSPFKKIDEKQEALMKEKAANDPKMRTTKDMKLNFNKSFQTIWIIVFTIGFY